MASLGLATGAVIAAMLLIVRELDAADGQQLVHIKGLNSEAVSQPNVMP
ncbi:hypothetical protein QFZ75_004075 [Streptomyces sp. V3I8]|nr:hypothetical protein [Streptomyces sp. V3I8]MDQ1037659.1 hypothetical protein [Streptomyces sp. V3I8]